MNKIDLAFILHVAAGMVLGLVLLRLYDLWAGVPKKTSYISMRELPVWDSKNPRGKNSGGNLDLGCEDVLRPK